MKTILSEKLPRILKNKKRLEEELNVKITNRGKEVFIDGEPEDEYAAEKVIDALNFGFSFSSAISIKKEDFIFEVLNIKDYTRGRNYQRIRARIIGKNGKTLKTLCTLTNCNFEVKDNLIGVLGNPEDIRKTNDAIISIIRGSKQANVYARLEKLKRTIW